jgi:hypothetical protein
MCVFSYARDLCFRVGVIGLGGGRSPVTRRIGERGSIWSGRVRAQSAQRASDPSGRRRLQLHSFRQSSWISSTQIDREIQKSQISMFSLREDPMRVGGRKQDNLNEPGSGSLAAQVIYPAGWDQGTNILVCRFGITQFLYSM